MKDFKEILVAPREARRRADKTTVRSWCGVRYARCSATGREVVVLIGQDAQGDWCVDTCATSAHVKVSARAYPTLAGARKAAKRVSVRFERADGS